MQSFWRAQIPFQVEKDSFSRIKIVIFGSTTTEISMQERKLLRFEMLNWKVTTTALLKPLYKANSMIVEPV